MNPVDEAILKVILPECYRIINELLKSPDKKTVIEAKRILPKQYSESYEHQRS